jgi:hypothetical protein
MTYAGTIAMETLNLPTEVYGRPEIYSQDASQSDTAAFSVKNLINTLGDNSCNNTDPEFVSLDFQQPGAVLAGYHAGCSYPSLESRSTGPGSGLCQRASGYPGTSVHPFTLPGTCCVMSSVDSTPIPACAFAGTHIGAHAYTDLILSTQDTSSSDKKGFLPPESQPLQQSTIPNNDSKRHGDKNRHHKHESKIWYLY